ncbi:16S rRNA (cytosine(1402)-N(4))-methyltransferase RsmH [Facklamia languida]
MSFEHETVLLKETIDGLDINPQGIYVDCTLGGAGHTAYLLDQLSDRGRVVAIDQDAFAIDQAKVSLADAYQAGSVSFVQDNFRHISKILDQEGIPYVDGIYYDLGVSSPQLDQAERGFSYHKEGRLDMRMDRRQDLDAYEVVNSWSYEDLVRILYRYGEEKFAKRIARKIEEERAKEAIVTTTQLAEIVKSAIPAATRRTGGHPAKRSFQAIRMAVNDELTAIEESVEAGLSRLKVGGRMAVITFHSLEDSLIKQIFRQYSTPAETPPNLPVMGNNQADYQLVNRKPIVASESELEENNRARSAKLRIIERNRIS